MENPWLEIPLADYEAHMSSPFVAQAQMLADVLAGEAAARRPPSVAVIGCAGGNGFDRMDPAVTRRVVGLDINAAYLEQARRRFGSRFESLELLQGDIEVLSPRLHPVDLAYAALILEYVDAASALRNMRTMLAPGGILLTVVQLSSPALPAVTPSPYDASLRPLEAIFRFLPPEHLRAIAAGCGLREIACSYRSAASVKRFAVQAFQRE